MNHLWVSSVLNMVLFVKPLHPIYLSKMELLNGKKNLEGNDEYDVDKFQFTSKLVGEAVLPANCIINKLPQK